MSKLLKSISKRLFWKQHLNEAIQQIQTIRQELVSPEMFIAAPLLFKGKGYYQSMEAKQNLAELLGVSRALAGIELNHVCEIGTHKGGTLFIWCQLASPGAKIISIDLPGGAFGGGYATRSLPFFQSFAKPQQQLMFIRGDSHSMAIQQEFKTNLQGKMLDFLLIDGDHSYMGVKSDFDHYAPFVRKGGIIAFHDIVKRPEYPEIEVWKYWEEIKSKYEAKVFIDDSATRRKIGIGIIYKR